GLRSHLLESPARDGAAPERPDPVGEVPAAGAAAAGRAGDGRRCVHIKEAWHRTGRRPTAGRSPACGRSRPRRAGVAPGLPGARARQPGVPWETDGPLLSAACEAKGKRWLLACPAAAPAALQLPRWPGGRRWGAAVAPGRRRRHVATRHRIALQTVETARLCRRARLGSSF